MENYQNILFPYAYNILGSVDEAKDAIQDVLLKYVQKEVQADNEKNYLIRSVINQSINRKRRKKRIELENDLPQPIVTSYEDSFVETKDLLSYSLMILLEKLNAKERAVFILKEAFAYTHQEIAVVLTISVENSRKLLSRATSKMRTAKPGIQRSSRPIAEKLEQFTRAIQSRDLDQLHNLLQRDIVFRADGGKEVMVVAEYMSGAQDVAALMIDVYHRFQSTYHYQVSEVNNQPAILYYDGSGLKVCQVFELDPITYKIQSIHVILDPAKLKLLQT